MVKQGQRLHPPHPLHARAPAYVLAPPWVKERSNTILECLTCWSNAREPAGALQSEERGPGSRPGRLAPIQRAKPGLQGSESPSSGAVCKATTGRTGADLGRTAAEPLAWAPHIEPHSPDRSGPLPSEPSWPSGPIVLAQKICAGQTCRSNTPGCSQSRPRPGRSRYFSYYYSIIYYYYS
jgi:hypothetical protein